MVFKDRAEAGRMLAEKLKAMKIADPVVYGIPRGGLVCADMIAKALQAPLSAVITRKIGHPDNPEYAIGAVAEDGDYQLSLDIEGIDSSWLKAKIAEKRQEAKNRREYILGGEYPLSARGRTAIIADDGLATGLTMAAAIKEIKHLQPKRIIVAVAVAAAEVVREIEKSGCEVIALDIPEYFKGAVGAYFTSFEQVSDDEARRIFSGRIKK